MIQINELKCLYIYFPCIIPVPRLTVQVVVKAAVAPGEVADLAFPPDVVSGLDARRLARAAHDQVVVTVVVVTVGHVGQRDGRAGGVTIVLDEDRGRHSAMVHLGRWTVQSKFVVAL